MNIDKIVSEYLGKYPMLEECPRLRMKMHEDLVSLLRGEIRSASYNGISIGYEAAKKDFMPTPQNL